MGNPLHTQYNKAAYVTLWSALCLVSFLTIQDYQFIHMTAELQAAIQGLGSAVIAFCVPNKDAA